MSTGSLRRLTNRSFIITSPARDSGGAEYCNWFVCLSVTPCT